MCVRFLVGGYACHNKDNEKEDEDSLGSLEKATFSSLHVSYVASMIKHMFFFRSIHFRRDEVKKGKEMMLWRDAASQLCT